MEQLRTAGADAILVGQIPVVSPDSMVIQATNDTNNKLIADAAGQPEVAVFDPFDVVFTRADLPTFRLDK